MSLRAKDLMKLAILLVLGGVYGEAAQADEQKCSARRLYANLMKFDSDWEVEENPLPPQARMEVRSVAFQPVRRLAIQDGAIYAAPFRSDFKKARIRVVGKTSASIESSFSMHPFPKCGKPLR
ncbi:hypothetical protein [Bradyrhizobium sp. HKCCYLS20291]|uniref:hypothetical protein n=1 Tax=Bradyrhizobium sp. HKCCYLS20291 TaxID=3420766 RepID=UPI003EBBB2E4